MSLLCSKGKAKSDGCAAASNSKQHHCAVLLTQFHWYDFSEGIKNENEGSNIVSLLGSKEDAAEYYGCGAGVDLKTQSSNALT